VAESARKARVLYVDDDTNLLQAVVRQHRQHFDITTCNEPEQALVKLTEDASFVVVVSDLRMPGMDGIELLRRVGQVRPHVTRIMLTGNADLEAATRAVNDGHVFRFLSKPCGPEDLREAIRAGARICELALAEQDLLERTLRGAVEVLTETLSLVNPAAFGRAARVRQNVSGLVAQLGLSGGWQFEVAAMLSQIGCVTVPANVAEKAFAGEALDGAEQQMFAAHPSVGRQLIRAIPRLEEVAEMIGLQDARFDGKGGQGAPAGEAIPIGARLLKVALDLDDRMSRGTAKDVAVEVLCAVEGAYDPAILQALRELQRTWRAPTEREVTVKDLIPGMVIATNLCAQSGLLLVAAGQQVTASLIQRLDNWSRSPTHKIQEPVRVLVQGPAEGPQA
jgi:response regulator RpfG family c-di-GMP phosphodiesterase